MLHLVPVQQTVLKIGHVGLIQYDQNKQKCFIIEEKDYHFLKVGF